MDSKICNTCLEDKDLNLFPVRGRGYRSRCKSCCNEIVRINYKPRNKKPASWPYKFPKDITGFKFGYLTVIKHIGTVIIGKSCKKAMWECKCECGNIRNVVRYSLVTGNTKGCKECVYKRLAAKLTKSKGSVKDRAREYRLQRLFNITSDDYQSILTYQNNICPISKIPSKKLCLDHDHKTGLIRGLIDWKINRALEAFRDNPEWLRAAADYLENPTATLALGENVYGMLGSIGKMAKNIKYGPDGAKIPQLRQSTIDFNERNKHGN